MESLLEQLDARIAPEHIVLRDSQRAYAWHEIRERVLRVAHLLTELELQRVALHCDNNVDWIVVDLACQHAGCVNVPIPLFFSAEQIDYVLGSTAIQGLFTQSPELISAQSILHESADTGSLLLALSVSDAAPSIPLCTGKITFTSGSTGRPKGVCLSNAQQLLQAQNLCEATGLTNPLHLCVLPLSTLLENIAGVYSPLLAGGTVVLRSLSELGFAGSSLVDPGHFLGSISSVRPDTMILIPQLLQVLLYAIQSGWAAPAMKFIAVGGSRVSAALIRQARTMSLPVYEGYGLSECASVVSLNTVGADLPGSCGLPLPHILIKLRNGEIIVSGNAMLGYMNEPDSWYQKEIATGDLGRFDDAGFLHIEGRCKNVLISSYGRNIAPEWVESELQALGLFREVVVMGDARPWCIALLTPMGDAINTMSDEKIQQAIDRVNQHLPDYARIRQWLRLSVPLAVNPALLTPNGRPRRDAIASHFEQEIDRLYRSEELLQHQA